MRANGMFAAWAPRLGEMRTMFPRLISLGAVALVSCVAAFAVTGSMETAPGHLDTAPPFFLQFSIISAPTLGDDLEIVLTPSEPLLDAPLVEVNGQPLSPDPHTEYTYHYVVTPADRFKHGQFHIASTDLAGNGYTIDTTAPFLQALPVPLDAWPLAVGLAIAAAWAMRRRAARRTLLVLLTCVAAARTEHPSVTNAAFYQQAVPEGGTEIHITYDLYAPNGPCNIRVEVSKEAGDGYPYLAAALTGDLQGVSTGTGYHLLWNVAQDLPNKDWPIARLRIVADDGVPEFTLTYTAEEGGTLAGETTQAVLIHRDGTPVTAIPDGQHLFLGWSDDTTANPRTDLDIQQDLAVSARFIRLYQLTYTAGPHGHIDGVSPQFALPGTDGAPVTAVPDPGFDFIQWSDGVNSATRTDLNVNDDLDVAAVFAYQIIPTVSVPAGTFTMGRTSTGDDQRFGSGVELPRHEVTLRGYIIAKTETTNRQFATALNYALSQGYLLRSNGQPWAGAGDIYAGNPLRRVLAFSASPCDIQFVNGAFVAKARPALSSAISYDLGNNPVLEVTWYGAAFFTNWISEIQGLQLVYDPVTFAADFSRNGYHLVTEAQWERAAAWDGTKHWTYGITADTMSGKDRVCWNRHNPLALNATPQTAPGGWYNGQNINLNGGIPTIDSPSPVGCYDMSGNVAEWCHDWYLSNYYAQSPATDPTGPGQQIYRVVRGGHWQRTFLEPLRTAHRAYFGPTDANNEVGFRVARF